MSVPLVSLDWTSFAGPNIVAVQVNALLMGITICQNFTYFCSSSIPSTTSSYLSSHHSSLFSSLPSASKDPKYIPILVVLLNVVCLMMMASELEMIWIHMMLIGDNAAESSDAKGPSRFTVYFLPFAPGLAAAIAQTFFAIRCWELCNRKRWVACIFGISILVSFSLHFALLCYSTSFRNFLAHERDGMVENTQGLEIRNVFLQICYATTALVDVLITAVLITKLMKEVRRLSSRRIGKLINKILSLSIRTATLTSVSCTMVTGLLNERELRSSAFTPFMLTLPTLFTFSVLFTLNSRDSLRRRLGKAREAVAADFETETEMRRQ